MRPARREDAAAIRALILAVRINPTGLVWRRFLLAVDEEDRLIGCGQVKPHRDGTYELASIAVQPQYRGRGVARAIIERLLATNPPPLYLTCRESLRPFYEKFGFVVLQEEELPPYFRRLRRWADFMRSRGWMKERLIIMANRRIPI